MHRLDWRSPCCYHLHPLPAIKNTYYALENSGLSSSSVFVTQLELEFRRILLLPWRQTCAFGLVQST
jgi:hypothetical protein